MADSMPPVAQICAFLDDARPVRSAGRVVDQSRKHPVPRWENEGVECVWNGACQRRKTRACRVAAKRNLGSWPSHRVTGVTAPSGVVLLAHISLDKYVFHIDPFQSAIWGTGGNVYVYMPAPTPMQPEHRRRSASTPPLQPRRAHHPIRRTQCTHSLV